MQFHLSVDTRTTIGEASTSQMSTEESPSKDLYPDFLLGSPVHTRSLRGEASTSQTTTGKVLGSPIHGSQFRLPLHSDETIKMPYINYYSWDKISHFKVLIHRGEGAIVNDVNESVCYFDYNFKIIIWKIKIICLKNNLRYTMLPTMTRII